MLGNDIVDLNFCELPHYQHVRRLDRVCTIAEAGAVRRSADPVRALATVWACKEAAYKLLTKRFSALHFIPKEHALQIVHRDPAHLERSTVVYGGLELQVSIFQTQRWVHAVATSEAVSIRWDVCAIEDCVQGGRTASSESDAVRFLANSLLQAAAAPNIHLQFAEKVPVLHCADGGAAGMDVSLSHHGAFAAAAIAWPLEDNSYVTTCKASALTPHASEEVCSTCTA